MNQLSNYITERIRIDNIKILKFPIDGTYDDAIMFLKKQNFEEIYPDGYIEELANLAETKCFIHDSILNGFIIWFADTSKEDVSKDNPIFGITYESNKKIIYNVYYPKNSNNEHSHEYIDIVENDKKEFLKLLNKQFGWI